MRLRLLIAFTVILTAHALNAQQSLIYGPAIGLVPDTTGSFIRPLLGVPGASLWGEPVRTTFGFHNATVSPARNYSVAIRNEDQSPILVRFDSESPEPQRLGERSVSSESSVVLSPTGSHAAIFDPESHALQVFGPLPTATALVASIDLTGVDGTITQIAINDGGNLALIGAVGEESRTLWVAQSDGSLRQIINTQPVGLSFFPDRDDAVLGDVSQEVFLLNDIPGALERVPLLSSIDGIQQLAAVGVTADGNKVLVASGNEVIVLNLADRFIVRLNCGCRPDRMTALNNSDLFALNLPSSGPLTLINAGSEKPQIIVVPPAPDSNSSAKQGVRPE